MLKLILSTDKALEKLKSNSHKTFRDSIEKHWTVDKNGYVKSQSICWLFCWGKTKEVSKQNGANEAREFFNDLLGIPFDKFDNQIPHEWAQWARYTKVNIDSQLKAYLDKSFFQLIEESFYHSQGFQSSVKIRKAIEMYAMSKAQEYYQAKGYTVTDESTNSPYDLKCTKKSEVIYVEVKGTQTMGEQVILTPREVQFNKGEFSIKRKNQLFSPQNRPKMDLFVLSQIKISDEQNNIIASGGSARILHDWQIPSSQENNNGRIWAISYAYALPN